MSCHDVASNRLNKLQVLSIIEQNWFSFVRRGGQKRGDRRPTFSRRYGGRYDDDTPRVVPTGTVPYRYRVPAIATTYGANK